MIRHWLAKLWWLKLEKIVGSMQDGRSWVTWRMFMKQCEEDTEDHDICASFRQSESLNLLIPWNFKRVHYQIREEQEIVLESRQRESVDYIYIIFTIGLSTPYHGKRNWLICFEMLKWQLFQKKYIKIEFGTSYNLSLHKNKYYFILSRTDCKHGLC